MRYAQLSVSPGKKPSFNFDKKNGRRERTGRKFHQYLSLSIDEAT